MKDEAFQEFKEKILEIDPFLDPAENENLINKIFHKLQYQLGLEKSLLDVANLFITALNISNNAQVDTENSTLPKGLDLTSLKIDPSGKNFSGFINQINSITDKIVDPETRELILMPLLMQNFSKSFNVSEQMLELIDGLRCSDGSKPILNKDSLAEKSTEFIDYLRYLQAPSQSPEALPMSLFQMYGILQTISKFQSFGFALKQPKQIGACNETHFNDYASQVPRVGLYQLENPNNLGEWNNGNIRLSSSGIKRTYTIMHEIFHMFIPNAKYLSFNLLHIDNFKFFTPLLNQKDLIPITILTRFYPGAIPTQYTKTEEIGALDLLFTTTARNGGKAFSISENCNQKFKNPGEIFKEFCPDNKPPKLFMDTPYNQNLILQNLQENSEKWGKIFHKNLLQTLQVECLTAVSTGILKIGCKLLKLNKKNQEMLLSIFENSSRIGFMALNENEDSATNIAIFSGLITLIKATDLMMTKFGIKSPQESAQKLLNKIGESILKEDLMENLCNSINNSPQCLKKSINQFLFIFTLYSLDGIIRNLQNEDNKIPTPKIEEKILIGFTASICSTLIGAIFDIGIHKAFKNRRRNLPAEINFEAREENSRLASDLVNYTPNTHPTNFTSQQQVGSNDLNIMGCA
jgi:hypothetical protein